MYEYNNRGCLGICGIMLKGKWDKFEVGGINELGNSNIFIEFKVYER